MKKEFEVIKIDGGFMTVKADFSGTCTSCSVKKGCGSGILADLLGRRDELIMPLKNGAVVGGFVSLEVSSKLLFLQAFILYILPLLSLFLFGFLASIIFPEQELLQVIAGLFGLVLVLLWVKLFFR